MRSSRELKDDSRGGEPIHLRSSSELKKGNHDRIVIEAHTNRIIQYTMLSLASDFEAVDILFQAWLLQSGQ